MYQADKWRVKLHRLDGSRGKKSRVVRLAHPPRTNLAHLDPLDSPCFIPNSWTSLCTREMTHLCIRQIGELVRARGVDELEQLEVQLLLPVRTIKIQSIFSGLIRGSSSARA
jgi:hypothetical protein